MAALIDGGFAATLRTDPGIVGDISGNGRVNSLDASLVAQHAALIEVPQIPLVPHGAAASGLSFVGALVGGDLALVPSSLLVSVGSGESCGATLQTTFPSLVADDTESVDHLAIDSAIMEVTKLVVSAINDRELSTALEDAIEELLSALWRCAVGDCPVVSGSSP